MTTALRLQSAGGDEKAASLAPIIRPVRIEDVQAAAAAAFAAHSALASRTGHPSEHPTPAFSSGLMNFKVKDPNATGFVAEHAGGLVGSVFLNRFPSTPVAAIGPLTVDPAAEGCGAGRMLLEAALAAAHQARLDQVRLVQSPAHLRSLCLYIKLGFEAREPLVLMTSGASAASTDRSVRVAVAEDIPLCERLCARVLGFARLDEIRLAVAQKAALVALSEGHITGYATGIGLRGHAVGETTADITALIAAAPVVTGPGFFAPVRNAQLMHWLLERGYRAVWPATLMSSGAYQEPAGAYLPSIAY